MTWNWHSGYQEAFRDDRPAVYCRSLPLPLTTLLALKWQVMMRPEERLVVFAAVRWLWKCNTKFSVSMIHQRRIWLKRFVLCINCHYLCAPAYFPELWCESSILKGTTRSFYTQHLLFLLLNQNHMHWHYAKTELSTDQEKMSDLCCRKETRERHLEQNSNREKQSLVQDTCRNACPWCRLVFSGEKYSSSHFTKQPV